MKKVTDEILFAECKWCSAPPGRCVIEDLFEKSKLVDWRIKDRREYFAVFSKLGFDNPSLSTNFFHKITNYTHRFLNSPPIFLTSRMLLKVFMKMKR